MKKSFLPLAMLALILVNVTTRLAAAHNAMTIDDARLRARLNPTHSPLPKGTGRDPMTIAALRGYDAQIQRYIKEYLEILAERKKKYIQALIPPRFSELQRVLSGNIALAKKRKKPLRLCNYQRAQQLLDMIEDAIYNTAAHEAALSVHTLYRKLPPAARQYGRGRYYPMVLEAYVAQEHKEYIMKKLLKNPQYRKSLEAITTIKDQQKKVRSMMLSEQMKSTWPDAKKLYQQAPQQSTQKLMKLIQAQEARYQKVYKNTPKIIDDVDPNININPRLPYDADLSRLFTIMREKGAPYMKEIHEELDSMIYHVKEHCYTTLQTQSWLQHHQDRCKKQRTNSYAIRHKSSLPPTEKEITASFLAAHKERDALFLKKVASCKASIGRKFEEVKQARLAQPLKELDRDSSAIFHAVIDSIDKATVVLSGTLSQDFIHHFQKRLQKSEACYGRMSILRKLLQTKRTTFIIANGKAHEAMMAFISTQSKPYEDLFKRIDHLSEAIKETAKTLDKLPESPESATLKQTFNTFLQEKFNGAFESVQERLKEFNKQAKKTKENLAKKQKKEPFIQQNREGKILQKTDKKLSNMVKQLIMQELRKKQRKQEPNTKNVVVDNTSLLYPDRPTPMIAATRTVNIKTSLWAFCLKKKRAGCPRKHICKVLALIQFARLVFLSKGFSKDSY